MIKNNKAFSLIEMMVTLAVLGAVVVMMPKFFIANVSMNKYFEVETLLSRTRSLVMQTLQNKNTVLKMMSNIHGPEFVTCLQEVKPDANCGRFNMAQRTPIALNATVLRDQPNLTILNSKHGLHSNCDENCLFTIKTFYKVNCRQRSCDSIEFLVKTEKTNSTETDPSQRQISNQNELVILSKNDFKKMFTEEMSCSSPENNFLFGYNYLSRRGDCRSCGTGPTPCFSPTGGFQNSGVLRSTLGLDPETIALDEPIPEKITLKFDLQQATNSVLGRVDLTCVVGDSSYSLPTELQTIMMRNLRRDNQHQGTIEINMSDIKTGPSSYHLNCTLKGYDSQGLYVVSLSSIAMAVVTSRGGDGESPNIPETPDNPGGNGRRSTFIGGGFTVPSYSSP